MKAQKSKRVFKSKTNASLTRSQVTGVETMAPTAVGMKAMASMKS